MRHLFVFLTALLIVGSLTSCRGPGVYGEYNTPPTLGPIGVEDGGGERLLQELRASTNCAEVGEIVTFTVHLANQTPRPVTLTGAPLLDIVIEPTHGLTPVQRWSASPQYPTNINPVLAPGEERIYQWPWTADPVYAQGALVGNGVVVRLAAPYVSSEPSIGRRDEKGNPLPIGVKSLDMAQASYFCKDLPH